MAIDELLPPMVPFEHGKKVPLPDLVSKTLERLDEGTLKDISPNGEYVEVEATFAYGLDGSGSHAVYNDASLMIEEIDTTHFLVGGMALSKIEAGSDLLYYDKKMNSSVAERPCLLVPGKEDNALVCKVLKDFDREALQVYSCSLSLCIKTL